MEQKKHSDHNIILRSRFSSGFCGENPACAAFYSRTRTDDNPDGFTTGRAANIAKTDVTYYYSKEIGNEKQ